MATKRQPTPLIVLVGPTASGKSALSLELARRFNGEIICADSRTVYRGMDIGTAKPNAAERAEIAHHLLDVVEPDEAFSAADFKRLALEAIDAISRRGKLPIMVGGTGLYVDGVVFDFAFLPPAPTEEREKLLQLSVSQLQEKLREQNIPLPENKQNPRHLIRALETNGAIAVKKGLRDNIIIIGLDKDKPTLEVLVRQRVELMYSSGLKAEVEKLADQYGWQSPGLSAVGYREWQSDNTDEEILSEIVRNTMQYAKRQRTWFKRNPNIHWVQNSSEAYELIKDFLQQK